MIKSLMKCETKMLFRLTHFHLPIWEILWYFTNERDEGDVLMKMSIVLCLVWISLLMSGCSQPTLPNEKLSSDEIARTDLQESEISDGIEQVYDLTFEEVEIPQKTSNDFHPVPLDHINAVLVEYLFDTYTFMIYQRESQDDLIYVGYKADTATVHEIGEIGYGTYVESMSPYAFEHVTLFGMDLLKIAGVCGANCPITYYIDMYKGMPELFLGIQANGTETDLNGDGINELITTAGTAIETTIYIEENDVILKSELSTIPNAIQVYHESRNLFHILFENKKLAVYEYMDRKLHFVKLIDRK